MNEEKNRIDALDGIRTFAFLFIIATHTNGFCLRGIGGGIGVPMFIVLSGFLVILPFCKKEEYGYKSLKDVILFYIKKISRIIPLYWLVLFTVYWLDGEKLIGNTNSLIKNMFFISNTGHLWYLQQEMLFYLLTPIIVQICYLLNRKLKINTMLLAFILFVSGILLQLFLTADKIYLFSNGHRQQILIGLFIIGIAFGFFYKTIYKKIKLSKFLSVILDMLILFIIIIAICIAIYYKKYLPEIAKIHVPGWSDPIYGSIFTGILIIISIINSNGIVSKFLSMNIFKLLAKTSYCAYLVHFYMLPYQAFISDNKNFIIITLLSIGLGLISSSTIEPFFPNLLKKITVKIKVNRNKE